MQRPLFRVPCKRSIHKYPGSAIDARWESKMIDYEGQIRITVHGAPQWVWVDVKANSVAFARALLQAQFGRANVINVQQKRKR
jgi:hypothetical protein